MPPNNGNGNNSNGGENGGGGGGNGGGVGGGRYKTIPILDDFVFDVAEDKTSVGSVIAFDADDKDTISYSFADGSLSYIDPVDGTIFSINQSTGLITVDFTTPLDYERTTTYSLAVLATDLGGNTDTGTVTINVGDANEFDVTMPVDGDGTDNAVLEGAATGTTVGVTAFAEDKDGTNNTVTYMIVTSETDTTPVTTGPFQIDSNTGEITVQDGSQLDYETSTSETVWVKATSSDGSSAVSSFNINVGDANEFDVTMPVDGDGTSNSVQEGAAAGTAVGVTAFAVDQDGTNNTVSYMIVTDAGGATELTDGPYMPSGAMLFDGVDDYVEVIDRTGSSLDISRSLTIESWVNFTEYPNCCWNAVVAKTYSHPTENTSYGLAFSNHPSDPTSSDRLYGWFGGGGTDTPATGIRNGAWHHLASVFDFDAGQTRLYVDGMLVDTNVRSTELTVTNFSLYIGNQLGHGSRTFKGLIDEVRIWNGAQSAVEINALKDYSLSGSESGLAAYYNFDEGGGTILHDRSGNGNDGTIYGGARFVNEGPALKAVASFQIDSNTGVITVRDGSLLDYETSTSETVWVKATSSDGSSAIESFVIHVEPVADEPTLKVSASPLPDAAPVIPKSEVYQVNTYETSDQRRPSVTALEDGGYVITWDSFGQDGSLQGIYGQRYASGGVEVATEFHISTHTTDSQYFSNVTGLSNGGFVVTWWSRFQDGSNDGIYAQIFDDNGDTDGGELRINDITSGLQRGTSGAGLPGGDFVIAWQDPPDIYISMFDSTGTQITKSLINDGSGNISSGGPKVSVLSDGSYAVTWSGYNSAILSGEIYTRIINPDGSKSPITKVNEYSVGLQYDSQVTALENGGYVVLWESEAQDTDGWGIYGQLFDDNGLKLNGVFIVNDTVSGDQLFSHFSTSSGSSTIITELPDGGFFVVWQSGNADGTNWGIYGKRYDADGNAVGSEYLIASPNPSLVTEGRTAVSVAALADGSLVVAWESDGDDGSGYGVYSQRFDLTGKTMQLDISAALTDTDGSETLSVTISDIPDGATLTNAAEDEIVITAGSATLDPDQLDGLTLTLPPTVVSVVTLAVTATATEIANGDTASTSVNVIIGTDASETLSSTTANDVVLTYAGDDTFVFSDGDGHDRLIDFTAGGTEDDIDFSGVAAFTDFADAQAGSAQVGSDVVITVDADNSVTLVGVNIGDLTSDDFVFS